MRVQVVRDDARQRAVVVVERGRRKQPTEDGGAPLVVQAVTRGCRGLERRWLALSVIVVVEDGVMLEGTVPVKLTHPTHLSRSPWPPPTTVFLTGAM